MLTHKRSPFFTRANALAYPHVRSLSLHSRNKNHGMGWLDSNGRRRIERGTKFQRLRYRGGWEQMTAMLLKIESSYIGYRADFTPISIDFCNVTVFPFPPVVTILLGITHRKRFCPSSRAMPARGSSFRREPFYLGSGQGRRRVSHAAHRAATINDRRVIKVGQCPSVIITRVISNSAIVVRG